MPAFHYAFLVRDLDVTRSFYAGLLGCREGRSAPSWIDFDFFGHQISAHLGDPSLNPRNVGHVDGIQVPMPHFGALLDVTAFDALAARLEAAATPFVIAPCTRYPGLPAEQRTMFLLDPSGNALEFKAFRHPDHVFDN